jgi:hypothetical protein
MWASTADDTFAVTIEWDQAATMAWDAGRFDETAELPRPDVRVTLSTGRQLSAGYCTDILTPETRTDATAPAAAGAVELVVEPVEGGFEPAGNADLSLRDIVFEVIHGTEPENWCLEQLVLPDVSVGWFAG